MGEEVRKLNKKDIEKENDGYVSYFEQNKDIADKYDKQLGLLLSKAKSIFAKLDTTDIDDVDFGNSIVEKINLLIDTMSNNQNISIPHLKLINYTDMDGNPLLDFFTFVVGSTIIEKGEVTFLNRRLVKARDFKEAVLKYKKVVDDGSTTVSCLGKFDETESYSKDIENMELID